MLVRHTAMVLKAVDHEPADPLNIPQCRAKGVSILRPGGDIGEAALPRVEPEMQQHDIGDAFGFGLGGGGGVLMLGEVVAELMG